MYINDVTLCLKHSGASQESSLNNIQVAYPTSHLFSSLECSLSGCREQFQQDLTPYLLLGGYVDAKQISGEVVLGEDSINIQVNIGYRRI